MKTAGRPAAFLVPARLHRLWYTVRKKTSFGAFPAFEARGRQSGSFWKATAAPVIGDDVKGIAEEFGGPWPVYTMDSGGLKGSFEKGFARAFLRVVEEMKEGSTVPASVNVLGLSEVYLKGREEGNEIRRILKGCGIRVISTPGCESSWHEIMEAPKASFNLVVRDELGLPAAKEMERKFGVPVRIE